jgi:hypothetical protein
MLCVLREPRTEVLIFVFLSSLRSHARRALSCFISAAVIFCELAWEIRKVDVPGAKSSARADAAVSATRAPARQTVMHCVLVFFDMDGPSSGLAAVARPQWRVRPHCRL